MSNSFRRMANLEPSARPSTARLAEACEDCGHVRGEHYETFDNEHRGCASYDDLAVPGDGRCECSGFRE